MFILSENYAKERIFSKTLIDFEIMIID